MTFVIVDGFNNPERTAGFNHFLEALVTLQPWQIDHGYRVRPETMMDRFAIEEVTRDGKVAVSVYAVDRCYGGPEEGGWYYDVHAFTGYSERVQWDDDAAISAAKERLLRLFDEDQPRYPISSVCSDGPEYHVWVEGIAGEGDNSRQPRPRYC